MAGNKKLPHFGDIQDSIEFFETQDLSEYLEAVPEASFEIDLPAQAEPPKRPDSLAAAKESAAERIYDIMLERGVRKVELARRLGTSPAHVSKLLSGEQNLTIETM